MIHSTLMSTSAMMSSSIFKKIYLFFLASFLIPQLAICQYYFSAQVSSSDPCCISVSAGAHTGQPAQGMWSVEIDGSVYDFANDGNNFLHCVDANGTFTVDFLVAGYNGVYWTRDVNITDCSDDACCVPPEEADISVFEIPNSSPPTYEVCVDNDCPDAEYRFRCREVGASTWMDTYWITSDCVWEQFDDCKEYEVQIAFWTPACGNSGFSNSFIYATDCEACCEAPDIADITVTELPNSNPPTFSVCLDTDCPSAEYRFRCREVGAPTWMDTYWITSNCMYEQFEECKEYEIQAAISSEWCGQTTFSESFFYGETCDDCCATPSIADISVTEVPNSTPTIFNVCLNTTCPDAEYRFRCREVGAPTWMDTYWITSNCMYEQFEDCKKYEIQVAISTDDCGQSAFSESFFYGEECESCCFFINPTVKPTPSCTGVQFCVEPMFADDTFCPGTTFTYGLYDANGAVVNPPFTTTFNCIGFLALDLCNIYYIRGSVNAPDCPPRNFNVQVNVPMCCDKGDGSDGPIKGTFNSGGKPKLIMPGSGDEMIQRVSVTPNPFDSFVEFSFESIVEDKYQIGLYDVNGILVSEEQGRVQTGANKLAVNYLNHLAPGVYIYRIQVRDQVYTERIIKK